jgi:hypothetical protein
LVIVKVLPQLLEAGVQIADVGNGIDDSLAIELEHEAQRGMGRRMLRTKIQAPQVILSLVTNRFGIG